MEQPPICNKYVAEGTEKFTDCCDNGVCRFPNALQSGYDAEQEVVFNWAASHGFTPVTSEIDELLCELGKSRNE